VVQPGAQISGAQAYRDFLGRFMTQLTGVRTLAAFGDDTTAVLFYYPHTAATSDAPTAECFTVAGGRSPAACSSLTGHRSPRRRADRGRSRPGGSLIIEYTDRAPDDDQPGSGHGSGCVPWTVKTDFADEACSGAHRR
jgi:hypothetical protein